MNPIKRTLIIAATSTAALVALANPAAAGDGNVDGRDFLIWTSTNTPTASYGDWDVDGNDHLTWSTAAGDGNVDGRDFLIWQRGFAS